MHEAFILFILFYIISRFLVFSDLAHFWGQSVPKIQLNKPFNLQSIQGHQEDQALL